MDKKKTNIGLKDKSAKNAHWYTCHYKLAVKNCGITNYSKPETYVINQTINDL
ncbi:hypothetical protein ACFQ5N_02260 [Lutibacter holmesii]|uniref:Uncharacterized protein n=1 Tax=Lutibacter holmesii TaxID=1137985 RepID=A0ABW3WLR3_9FLAO